ncbi:MAG TPA: UvrD-helicase domain-containing protein [Myxococcaceae bacterium]|nr:UvrD-helicase domain-containing protein [Myxococcaceae bacterium]
MSAPRPNACVFAGAGTGKTHGLITECLRLLGGADRDEPLPPARLCLLTFTEKAAAEMRGRLASRVAALASGEASELELTEAFVAAGRPLPPASEWRRLQTRLSGATIATFHAFCAGLLRRAPAGSGTPPDFVLLDDEESLDLLEELAERLVLERLEGNDVAVEALCSDLDLRGMRRSGLVELLVDQARRVRDHGHSPAELAITRAEDVHQALSETGARARALVEEALGRARAERGECEPVLAAIADALVGWGPDTALERAARLADLRDALPGRGGKNGLGAAVRAARDALSGGDSPLGAAALMLARPHEETWRALLVELAQRQRAAFDEAGALDFAELLIRARDLLCRDPALRAREQARIGALLLDEFQDTNVLQLELTFLLAEARDGAPRPLGSAGPRGLPLEPDLLCAVGDRKQSIYDFRGADVEVFEELARAVEAGGGERRFLRVSRRAQPELVTALNGVLGPILGPSPAAPWEVPFRPGEDDLLPWRPQLGPIQCLERLVAVAAEDRAEERRTAEADLLARRLALLLSPDAQFQVAEGERLRPVRGGDVAILLRSFVEVTLYTEALARHHVPHRVLRGRGIYASPEVRDVAALLGLLTDPRNPVHLAACLRGPAVGLSDATLVRLALSGGRLDARVLAGGLPPEALPGESGRWARFVSVARRLRARIDRCSLVDLLEEAWAALGTRTVLAASPHGEEQLGNLEVVRQLAGRWDFRGRSDPAAFARRLLELADRDPRIGLEEVEDARAGPAVQLLTVHAAKGLEWPVVCIADLGASRPPSTGRLLVDPRNGLAFRPTVPWSSDSHPTPRSTALAEVLASRELAESRRVLYVAMTRARDHLLLSGIQGRGGARSWAAWIDPVLDAPEVRSRVLRLDDGACPPLPPRPATPPLAVEPARVRAALGRLEPVTLPPPARVPLEALEALDDCPRRFQLRVLEGHREPGGGAAGAVRSPRHRDSRLEVLRQLLAVLPDHAWHAGLPDDALARAAGRVGLTLPEAEALRLAAPMRRLARALRGFGAEFSWARAVPFELKLGAASVQGAFDLHLAGAPGEAVVRLVAGAPTEARASAAVLLEALRARAGEGRQVRAALFFVDGNEEKLRWVSAPPVSPAELDARLVAALALGPALTEGLERAGCEALGCGFVPRCHPAERGL